MKKFELFGTFNLQKKFNPFKSSTQLSDFVRAIKNKNFISKRPVFFWRLWRHSCMFFFPACVRAAFTFQLLQVARPCVFGGTLLSHEQTQVCVYVCMYGVVCMWVVGWMGGWLCTCARVHVCEHACLRRLRRHSGACGAAFLPLRHLRCQICPPFFLSGACGATCFPIFQGLPWSFFQGPGPRCRIAPSRKVVVVSSIQNRRAKK